MSYLAVAYPKLREEDFDWIQSYRKKNDPRFFDLVRPHFTFVFAIHDIPKDLFLEETRNQCTDFGAFDFELRLATVNLDDSKEYCHEFLVPEKGYSKIAKLHDKLYSGAFSRHLRFDLAYIPHIGIGNSDDALVSKNRVDDLNRKGVDVSGVVDAIDVIELKDGVVRTIEAIPLAQARP